MDNVTKWYTIIENVNNETGEILRQKLNPDEYIVIRKQKPKYKIQDGKGYKTITNECEPNRQRKLF